jgi:hypothetical protein
MDPYQTAWMCRLVWIHAGRKPIMLVLSWHGHFMYQLANLSAVRYKSLKLFSNLRLITGIENNIGVSYYNDTNQFEMKCSSKIALKVNNVLLRNNELGTLKC